MADARKLDHLESLLQSEGVLLDQAEQSANADEEAQSEAVESVAPREPQRAVSERSLPAFREACVTAGGLIDIRIRRVVWPTLANITAADIALCTDSRDAGTRSARAFSVLQSSSSGLFLHQFNVHLCFWIVLG